MYAIYGGLLCLYALMAVHMYNLNYEHGSFSSYRVGFFHYFTVI